jgi:hypothetical protein
MPAPVIPSATAVKTLQVNGGNLFRMALDNLGDALQWNRIAAANRLLDPFLPANALTTLVVPPINFSASDSGVLQPNMGAPVFAPGPGSDVTLSAVVQAPTTLLIPVNINPPSISGTPHVGQQLTASAGTWSNSPFAFAFEWRRAGTIVGVTAAYTIAVGDDGMTLTVSVIAVNSAGPSLPAISGATVQVSSDFTYDFSDRTQSGIQFWLKAS